MVLGTGCQDPPRSKTFLALAGEGGGSSATLVLYCDGVKRVTKVMGNPQRNIILVNELVTARLAELIGAPCPEGIVVEMDGFILEDARKNVRGLDNAGPGPAFGSLWSEAMYSPGVDICQQAVNRHKLAGLIVLYTWCRNSDFKPSHLMYRSTGGGIEVLGVDHGHCFEYTWDGAIRDKAGVTPIRTLDVLNAVVDPADFGPFLDALEAMDRDAISGCLDVPHEWGVTRPELSGLEEYLVESRSTVTQAVRDAFHL